MVAQTRHFAVDESVSSVASPNPVTVVRPTLSPS